MLRINDVIRFTLVGSLQPRRRRQRKGQPHPQRRHTAHHQGECRGCVLVEEPQNYMWEDIGLFRWGSVSVSSTHLYSASASKPAIDLDVQVTAQPLSVWYPPCHILSTIQASLRRCLKHNLGSTFLPPSPHFADSAHLWLLLFSFYLHKQHASLARLHFRCTLCAIRFRRTH